MWQKIRVTVCHRLHQRRAILANRDIQRDTFPPIYHGLWHTSMPPLPPTSILLRIWAPTMSTKDLYLLPNRFHPPSHTLPFYSLHRSHNLILYSRQPPLSLPSITTQQTCLPSRIFTWCQPKKPLLHKSPYGSMNQNAPQPPPRHLTQQNEPWHLLSSNPRLYLLIDFFDDSIKNSTSTQRPNFDVF